MHSTTDDFLIDFLVSSGYSEVPQLTSSRPLELQTTTIYNNHGTRDEIIDGGLPEWLNCYFRWHRHIRESYPDDLLVYRPNAPGLSIRYCDKKDKKLKRGCGGMYDRFSFLLDLLLKGNLTGRIVLFKWRQAPTDLEVFFDSSQSIINWSVPTVLNTFPYENETLHDRWSNNSTLNLKWMKVLPSRSGTAVYRKGASRVYGYKSNNNNNNSTIWYENTTLLGWNNDYKNIPTNNNNNDNGIYLFHRVWHLMFRPTLYLWQLKDLVSQLKHSNDDNDVPVGRVYCWHALHGYWRGLDTKFARNMAGLKSARNIYFPNPSDHVLTLEPAIAWDPVSLFSVGLVTSPSDVATFYQKLHQPLVDAGIDGVKVDVHPRKIMLHHIKYTFYGDFFWREKKKKVYALGYDGFITFLLK
mmetsp:Transcript_15730/g.18167  ORF Transcript_15730/g.18167 Transcript_15730/m.18167 type:complete len:411 (-) Transcript_15730:35-1267(-)